MSWLQLCWSSGLTPSALELGTSLEWHDGQLASRKYGNVSKVDIKEETPSRAMEKLWRRQHRLQLHHSLKKNVREIETLRTKYVSSSELHTAVYKFSKSDRLCNQSFLSCIAALRACSGFSQILSTLQAAIQLRNLNHI